MKNSQKGFIVPVLLVIIALLVVGGGVYVYKNKKVEVPAVVDTGTQPTNTNTQTPPVNTQTKTPTPTPKDETLSWKIYQNDFFKYEFQYPSGFAIVKQDNYLISIVNTSSCINKVDLKIIPSGCWKIYSEVVDSVGSISGMNVKKYEINIQGVKGLRTELVSQYDAGFANIIVEVNKDNKWYVLRVNFNLSDEKSVRLLFDKILSTFKFTGQYIPTSPTFGQQNVINYLEANITNLVKAKPVLGSTKWGIYNVYFYDPDKIIVGFEDGHITGGFIGSYSVNGNVVSVQYIDEIMNTGNEISQLSNKYNLPSDKAIKYTRTSSGFELVK